MEQQKTKSSQTPCETRILESANPIEPETHEEVEVLGEKGICMNKSEIRDFSGPIPIEQYEINQDPNPDIIRKKPTDVVNFTQEFAVRYLRPPTPPPPGDIVIVEEDGIEAPEAPPVIIRQEAARLPLPAQEVIREAPPKPPQVPGEKIIKVPGKRLPPPPRRVIIERLAPQPAPPPPILVERWLSYPVQQRRVIFRGAKERIFPKQKNLIIQWDSPQFTVTREYRDLGVVRANPSDFSSRYGSEIKQFYELPDYVRYLQKPHGLVLSADMGETRCELVGDLYALSLIDLDKEGLSEYKSSVQPTGYTLGKTQSSNAPQKISPASQQMPAYRYQQPFSESSKSEKSQEIINGLVSTVVREPCNKINVSEVKRIMRNLGEKHRKQINDQDVEDVLHKLDRAHTGIVDYQEFLRELSTFYWDKL